MTSANGTVDNTAGNVGTFSTTGQAQLPQVLGEAAPTTFTLNYNGGNYVYLLGGFG